MNTTRAKNIVSPASRAEAREFLDAQFSISGGGHSVTGHGSDAISEFRRLCDEDTAAAIIAGRKPAQIVISYFRNGVPVSGVAVNTAMFRTR